MKIRMFAVAALLALLPFAAEAQHGGGGSSSGSGGGARSTNSGGSRSSNSTGHATRTNQAGGKATFQKQRPANNQSRSTDTRPTNGRGTATQRETVVGRAQVRSEHVAVGAYHHRGFWPGGLFWGAWYAPGWYYSVGFAPELWYYGPAGYGYQYSVGEPSDLSGIKFDLDQIPKNERKTIENGNVLLDGDEATNGRVKNFSGLGNKKILLLGPGDHDITVRIKGGQEITMSAVVQPGHVTHVALSFDQERKEGKQFGGPSLPPPGTKPLTPAPAPTDSPTN